MEFGEGAGDGILPPKPQWKKLDRSESQGCCTLGIEKPSESSKTELKAAILQDGDPQGPRV